MRLEKLYGIKPKERAKVAFAFRTNIESSRPFRSYTSNFLLNKYYFWKLRIWVALIT